jgi:uncharacterized protein
MPHLRQILLGFSLFLTLALLPLGRASGAEDEQGASFLTPFPEGEIYQLTVVGDTFAEGLLAGLIEALGTDARVNIQKKHREVSGVMSADFEARMKEFEETFSKEPVSIAVVMLGEDDRVPLKGTSSKKTVAIGAPEWRAEYARRIDRLMKAVKRKTPSVYWVGLPNFSRNEANEQTQIMNEIMRERAYLNGFRFIDTFAGFLDETGAYSAYGPDLAGKIRVLREGDGVHFTAAGNRKLAHFVEKDLRRDMTQAKSERTVPLMGAETEQAKINPDNVAAVVSKAAPPASNPAAAGAPPVPGATAQGGQTVKVIRAEGLPGTPPSADPSGDQKADNGKITFKIAGANGREEMQTVEILRPAIPASVVALMARRETQGQAGDLLVDQIAGGLTLMSSITPSGSKGRGKLSPAQAPYFRLLVKGERLTPKPGRADDVAWPSKGDTTGDADKSPAPKG